MLWNEGRFWVTRDVGMGPNMFLSMNVGIVPGRHVVVFCMQMLRYILVTISVVTSE